MKPENKEHVILVLYLAYENQNRKCDLKSLSWKTSNSRS